MTALTVFLFFALIGMGTEAFFTGISPIVEFILLSLALFARNIYTHHRKGIFARIVLWLFLRIRHSATVSSFTGRVWIGMFVVYGFSAFPFGILYDLAHTLHWALRIPIYGACIMGYEFVSGLIIVYGWKALTGTTFYPWRYEKRGNIMHLVQISYFKYWCLYGIILEYFYTKLMQ